MYWLRLLNSKRNGGNCIHGCCIDFTKDLGSDRNRIAKPDPGRWCCFWLPGRYEGRDKTGNNLGRSVLKLGLRHHDLSSSTHRIAFLKAILNFTLYIYPSLNFIIYRYLTIREEDAIDTVASLGSDLVRNW